MRNLNSTFIALLITTCIFAQTPEKLSYQAVIRNSSNQLVSSQVIGMKISILQGSATGTPVYVETQVPTTNTNGLVTIEIGTGTVVSGIFSTINWSSGLYFVKTEADPSGGANYTITGTSQLLSVPYAFYSKISDYNNLLNKPDLFNGTWSALSGKPSTIAGYGITDFDFSGVTTNDLLKYNGTKWVKFTPNYLTGYTENQNLTSVLGYGNNGNGKQIKNIANPTDSQDAVTKSYVDSLKQNIKALENLLFSQISQSSQGLIGYYSFNGNPNDGSATANNGMVNGAVLTKDRFGNDNQAYYFDGVDDYIQIAGGLPFKNTFTISFWAYSQNESGYHTIINDGSSSSGGNDFLIGFNGRNISVRADKNAVLNYEDNQPPSLSNLDIFNKWVHVCWVMNPTSSKIYLNGILISNINEVGNNDGFHNDYSLIGARNIWGSPDNFFMGKLDDIRFYNRSFSDIEIKQLFYEGGFPNTLISDVDGNTYNAIKIGNQYWMAQNLQTTKYSNGDPIPNVTDNTTWINSTVGAYSDYNNSPSNSIIYGRLYNYYTVVDSRGLCPSGWHVPSDTEWETLFTYLGGSSIAGGKLKEAGTIHWNTPNTDATNESGFTGLPSGYRNNTGVFSSLGTYSNLWTSTSASSTNANIRGFGYNYAHIFNTNFPKHNGLSVRCVKD